MLAHSAQVSVQYISVENQRWRLETPVQAHVDNLGSRDGTVSMAWTPVGIQENT
jgi:hypothetical protein